MLSGLPLVVVADTSVLINFLKIDRMDLIGRHSCQFLITDHVVGEVADHYPEQQERLHRALADCTLTQEAVTDPAALDLFGRLVRENRLGTGECSAIALAIHRGHGLAIDDSQAGRLAAGLAPALNILSTQDLMVSMIGEGLIDVAEADAIKDVWAVNHRFRLKVSSFSELLGENNRD